MRGSITLQASRRLPPPPTRKTACDNAVNIFFADLQPVYNAKMDQMLRGEDSGLVIDNLLDRSTIPGAVGMI